MDVFEFEDYIEKIDILWREYSYYKDYISKTTKHCRAGENITAGKAVYIESDERIYIFDITNPDCYPKYIGIAAQTTLAGSVCEIVTHGLLNTLTTFTPSSTYYIQANGSLGVSEPVSGLVKAVGVGVDGSRLLVITGQSSGDGGESTGSDVLIDCGTITDPTDYVLIDCGTII